MGRGNQSNVAATRWASRLTPIFILLGLAFATYAAPVHLCINYLLRQESRSWLATVLLVLYFVFFTLMLAAYGRTFLNAHYSPGIVPLSDEREAYLKHQTKQRTRGDIEAQPWVPPDQNPDSPGLEAFYSKDVFVCEADGRPKWCSECRQWKPDRARHSSELERCIRKMDHLCPWVGGMVSETSFNFFFQFTFYATFYLTVCLATGAYCIQLRNRLHQPLDVLSIVLTAVSAFFLFFAFAMTATSARFLVNNTTNIDALKKSSSMYLAVKIPWNSPPNRKYATITYPLKYGSETSNMTDQSRGSHIKSSRDDQALHRFAVLATEPGENPWDVGYMGNIKSVMGNNIFEWLLPLQRSPCCNHESMMSDYEIGPLLSTLQRRYGVTMERTGKA